jgi:4-coumarate--CoA ligase
VADVAVIGIPDDYAGEVPKAFVVLRENVTPTNEIEDSLKSLVKRVKSRPSWLAGGIQFVATIPKSASGKILRRTLREGERLKHRASKPNL